MLRIRRRIVRIRSATRCRVWAEHPATPKACRPPPEPRLRVAHFILGAVQCSPAPLRAVDTRRGGWAGPMLLPTAPLLECTARPCCAAIEVTIEDRRPSAGASRGSLARGWRQGAFVTETRGGVRRQVRGRSETRNSSWRPPVVEVDAVCCRCGSRSPFGPACSLPGVCVSALAPPAGTAVTNRPPSAAPRPQGRLTAKGDGSIQARKASANDLTPGLRPSSSLAARGDARRSGSR